MQPAMQRTISARIDRLPLSSEVWRIMLLAAIAWLVESYDIGVIGNVLPSLQAFFHLDTFSVGLLAIASTLGIVLAVIPAGWLADRIGRKRILVFGTAWYAFFSFLCGFAPTPTMLVLLRFVAGLGMGAIFPIPYALAAELTPRHFRGIMTGLLDSFLSVGYFLAPLLAFALIPQVPLASGWRWLFYIGGLPLLYVPVLLKWLPESPRWLESRGRSDEANAIVRYLETKIEQRSGRPLPEPQITADEMMERQRSGQRTDKKASRPAPTVFQGPYLKRTLMMWIAFACILFVFYAVQTYTPTVLVKEGYSLGNAFLMTTIIVLASIPGKATAAYLADRFGRKITLACFAILAALCALLFGFSQNMALVLGCGILLSFFGIGIDPVIKIYGAEQYPTRMRETGVGFFEGVGRLFGGALAPFIMSFVLASSGVPGSYIFVACLAIVGVVAVIVLGYETKGQTIEQTSAENSA
jgi:putative MFS transporter